MLLHYAFGMFELATLVHTYGAYQHFIQVLAVATVEDIEVKSTCAPALLLLEIPLVWLKVWCQVWFNTMSQQQQATSERNCYCSARLHVCLQLSKSIGSFWYIVCVCTYNTCMYIYIFIYIISCTKCLSALPPDVIKIFTLMILTARPHGQLDGKLPRRSPSISVLCLWASWE